MAFQLVMICYWLALSTWFGGVLFVALAAPVIFRTVREANPLLPGVLSVNLDSQHGTLLGGSIVGNLLSRLAQLELGCAAVLLLTLILQPFVIDTRETNLTAYIFRLVLFACAAATIAYDRFLLWPRISKARQDYLDHADEPDLANPAKDEFDRRHRVSVTLLSSVLFLLLGILLFSGGITPKRMERTVSTPTAVSLLEQR